MPPTAGRPPRLAVVVGTRPEVIKLFPVLAALRAAVQQGRAEVCLVATGQHRELLDQALGFFGLQPDVELDAMRPSQEPADLHARLVPALVDVLRQRACTRVVVQGDTVTAFSAAVAAFYAGLPVSHVEAGLRTFDPEQPFPEEMHRRWIGACADQHFCPTEAARHNLVAEGVPARDALVVGNTVIDAVRLVADRIAPPADLPPGRGRRLFVTVHRRENHARLEQLILPSLAAVHDAEPDLDLVVSVHPHPTVTAAVQQGLGGRERVHLLPPLDYGAALGLVRDSTAVVTDSGGLQEEATALGTPVLVLRRRTERAEALASGNALLLDGPPPEVAHRIREVLRNDALRARMARPSPVFGDGYAAERIAAVLLGAPA